MAENEHNEAPIIIKKGKKAKHGHHGGAWKVAYSDFVTAMMALFIVLWILAQNEDVKNNIAGYFNDPSGFGSGNGPSVFKGPGRNNNVEPLALTEFQKKEIEKERLTAMGKALKEELDKNGFEEFEGLMDVEIVDEGLRIELAESEKGEFFQVGTAKMKPSVKKILAIIAKRLSKINNKIVVEGHTDARPYPGNGMGYTNFELSADRANAARRVLMANGVKETQIDEIRGYADKRLRNPKNPFDASNRRISIIVKYSE